MRLLALLCVAALVLASAEGALLASWRLSKGGNKGFRAEKLDETGVKDAMVGVIRRYDAILLQEIQDGEHEEVVSSILAAVNEGLEEKEQYTSSVSPLTGQDFNGRTMISRTFYDEAHAMFVRKSSMEILGDHQYSDPGNKFYIDPHCWSLQSEEERKPWLWVAPRLDWLHDRNNNRVDKEAELLKAVIDECTKELVGEEDEPRIIVGGQWNTDCDYMSEEDLAKVPVLADKTVTMVTDVKSTSDGNCALTRFALNDPLLDLVVNESTKAFDFTDGDSPLASDEVALVIGDSFPVQIELVSSFNLWLALLAGSLVGAVIFGGAYYAKQKAEMEADMAAGSVDGGKKPGFWNRMTGASAWTRGGGDGMSENSGFTRGNSDAMSEASGFTRGGGNKARMTQASGITRTSHGSKNSRSSKGSKRSMHSKGSRSTAGTKASMASGATRTSHGSKRSKGSRRSKGSKRGGSSRRR